MTNNRTAFCQECGTVPFYEKDICGNCDNFTGYEGKCDGCQNSFGSWEFSLWSLYCDFEGSAADEAVPRCDECVMVKFEKEHPDYEKSGFEFESYLVCHEALASGYDLVSKLLDYETPEAIRAMHDYGMSRKQIVDWFRLDIPIDQAEQWLAWYCPPEKIAEYLAQGLSGCPDEEYRELGVNLEDAVFYELNGFTNMESEGYPYYIGYWLPSGLKTTQLLELRNALSGKDAEFESLHNRTQKFGKDEDFYNSFCSSLPFMFRALRKVGLKVDIENLRRYWGLDASQILKVIDIGGEVEQVANMVRLGVPVAKAPLFEKLVATGVSESISLLLVKRGILHKHLKQLEKQENIKLSIEILYELLMLNQPMKVDEALKWLVSSLDIMQVKFWATYEFDAEVAVKWAQEGFNPIATRQWIAAGVNSPVTARRRRDAGINP